MKPTCQTCGNKVDTSLREVPEACVRLAEDCVALELAGKFLASVNPANISECDSVTQMWANADRLNTVQYEIELMMRHAKRKLAAGYLAP